MSNAIVNPILERVALGIVEQRHELGVSQRQLAGFSGVSRDTITRLERGRRVSPALLLRVAGVLALLELYRPPASTLDDELFAVIGQVPLPGEAWST
jgi:transcriptional regulator with XRE-family HTH domain